MAWWLIVEERSNAVSEEFGSESSTMAESGILCIVKQYKYLISTAIMPYKQKESIPKASRNIIKLGWKLC